MAHNYKKLQVWKTGIDLADLVYDFVADFPERERYNLISQSIRSACSVSANIAEGSAKSSDKDFKRFLEIALGSLYELETHLLIAERRKFGKPEALKKLIEMIEEEQRMLFGMIKTVKSRIITKTIKKTSLIIITLITSTLLLTQIS